MEIDQLGKLASIASAIGAAVGGIVSFVFAWGWKVWEKSDRIRVVYGHAAFIDIPHAGMHVVSLRDHPMEVVDFGFIHEDGRLISVPALWAEPEDEDPQHPSLHSGTAFLQARNDRYEVSVYLAWRLIGAYARTSTQDHPRLNFSRDTPWYRCCLTRLRHWRQVQYC